MLYDYMSEFNGPANSLVSLHLLIEPLYLININEVKTFATFLHQPGNKRSHSIY